MSKKYVEVEVEYNCDYLMYKKFCEANNIKPVKYENYSRTATKGFNKTFGELWEAKMWTMHGLEFATGYNSSLDLGKWLYLFEVKDQELFETTEAYNYLKNVIHEDSDVYTDEDFLKGRRASFKSRVNEFWGDD